MASTDRVTENLTRLLRRWRSREQDALTVLIPLVYDQLRVIARARLRGESLGNTLDTTGLAKAVELRYFAALTLGETAMILGVSAPTVMRGLRFAEAWLARELG